MEAAPVEVAPWAPRPGVVEAPLAPADIATTWRNLLPALVEALGLAGLPDRDIVVHGSPLQIGLGSWGSIAVVHVAGQPEIVVRAQTPHLAVLSVPLGYDLMEVVTDVADAAGVLLARRCRRLCADRAAMEAELAEMATSTGWHCTGVAGTAGPVAGFRDDLGFVSGRLSRIEVRTRDPASDRFSITVEVGSLRYADALAALSALHGVLPGTR